MARQTIATWLQAAGYMTGLFGKYINGYGFGAERAQGPGGTVYVPPGWTRWRAMTSPEHFGGVRGTTYTLVDEHGVPTLYDDHSSDRQYSTELLAAQLRTFIADSAGQGRPFIAVWTPYASHAELPGYSPQPAIRHFRFFRNLPPWRPLSFAEPDVSDKPHHIQALSAGTINHFILNDVIRIGAYETLLAVDEQLGVMLDDLVRLGIDRNTVILVTSDNGVSWGEHRLYFQGKQCPYEECLRVPMIVRDGRASGAAVYDAPVQTVDIAPTVAELAGIVPPVQTDGVSFASWIAGSAPPQWRDDVLIEHWRSIRNDSLRYTGQVTDGDQVRVLYGDTRQQPRPSVLFEFDAGGGVTPGAVAVPVGAGADESFANLGAAVGGSVPYTSPVHVPANDVLTIVESSPDHAGVYLLVERDQGAVIDHTYTVGDWFGVRNVAGSLTYVQHESGEVELYDLNVDPAQLENKATDPAYGTTRQSLALRLADLLR
jgi:Sulfatase